MFHNSEKWRLVYFEGSSSGSCEEQGASQVRLEKYNRKHKSLIIQGDETG